MAIELISSLARKNNGAFYLVREKDIQGGFRVVSDIAERDAIPEWARHAGMQVSVISEGYKTYRLGTDLTIAGQQWTVVDNPDALKLEDIGITVAPLNENKKIPESFLPSLFLNKVTPVNTIAEMIAVSSVEGNAFVVADATADPEVPEGGSTYFKLNNDDPADLADFIRIQFPGNITSVNEQTGEVTITFTDLVNTDPGNTAFHAKVVENTTVVSHGNRLSQAEAAINNVGESLTLIDQRVTELEDNPASGISEFEELQGDPRENAALDTELTALENDIVAAIVASAPVEANTLEKLNSLLTALDNTLSNSKANKATGDGEIDHTTAIELPQWINSSYVEGKAKLRAVLDILIGHMSFNTPVVKSQSSYTLSLADWDFANYLNFTTSGTINIPDDATVNFPIGAMIQFYSGEIREIKAASAVTLEGLSDNDNRFYAAKGSFGYVVKKSSNNWIAAVSGLGGGGGTTAVSAYRRNEKFNIQGSGSYIRIDSWFQETPVTKVKVQLWGEEEMFLRLTDNEANVITTNVSIINEDKKVYTVVPVSFTGGKLIHLDIKTLGVFNIKEIIIS